MGCQDKNWSRDHEGYCLLACSLQLTHLAFLYHSGPPAQDGTTHSQLGIPPSVINPENAPIDLLQVSLMEAILHWLFFSQDDPSLCQGHIKQYAILCIPHQQVNLREQLQRLFLLTNCTLSNEAWNIFRRNERDTACLQLLITPTTLPRVNKIGKTQSVCSIILMTTIHTLPVLSAFLLGYRERGAHERMSTAAVSQCHTTYHTSPDIPQRAKPVLMETCIPPNPLSTHCIWYTPAQFIF